MQNFGYFTSLLLPIGLGTEQSVPIGCMETEHLPGKTQKNIGTAVLHEN